MRSPNESGTKKLLKIRNPWGFNLKSKNWEKLTNYNLYSEIVKKFEIKINNKKIN